MQGYLTDAERDIYRAAIRGVFALDAPIPDQTLEVAEADTSAAIALSLLDRTENFPAPIPED